MNRPSLYCFTRSYRQHRAERRFGRSLRRLETLAIPCSRADLLDTMALTADLVSGYENRSDEACEAWGLTAGLLRAVAASERFGVLTDTWEYGDDEPQRICGPGYRDPWKALADAAVRNDRAGRACILHRLHEVIRDAPGAGILAEIAATELLVADARPPLAAAPRYRGSAVMTRAERRAAASRYIDAHAALWRSQAEEEAAGIRHETGTFHALNAEANAAAGDIPWWLEPVLDWRASRRLSREGIRL